MEFLNVIFYSVFTCVMAATGAVPFLVAHYFNVHLTNWNTLANCISCGMMIVCSAILANEGIKISMYSLFFGGTIGAWLIHKLDRELGDNENFMLGTKQYNKKAFLMIVVMTAHSVAEGVGLGVSFAGSRETGTFISTIIGLHNVPETIATCVTLLLYDVPFDEAIIWSVSSSIPQVIFSLPAYMFARVFSPLYPFGMGLASGAMLYIVVKEILEEQ